MNLLTFIVKTMPALVVLSACTPPPAEKTKTSNDLAIITPDWSIASTLVAIDAPPVATGDLRTLPDWSVNPKMPNSVIDLGARYTPNPELSAQLSADLLIYSGFYSHLSQMNGIKAYEYKGVNRKNAVPTWDDYQTAVMALGKEIGKEQQTAQYIEQTALHLAKQGSAFKQKHPNIKTLAIVQFGNANQLYNYTSATPFGATLDKMGIEIFDFGKANEWGSFITDISEISRLDDTTCLIVVKPFSTLLKKELSKHALWQYLGYDQGKKCAMVVEPVWAFGDFPSMVGFADNLLTATPYTDYGIGTTVKGNKLGSKQ